MYSGVYVAQLWSGCLSPLTLQHIAKDLNLNQHRCQNLKSRIISTSIQWPTLYRHLLIRNAAWVGGWSVSDELIQCFLLWSKRRRRSRKFWTSGPSRLGCSLESATVVFFPESFWSRRKTGKFYVTFSGVIILCENEKDTYLLQIIYFLEGNDFTSVLITRSCCRQHWTHKYPYVWLVSSVTWLAAYWTINTLWSAAPYR